MASMGPKEWWMRQSHEIWGHLGHPPRSDEGSSTCAGTKCPPPCSIGLRLYLKVLPCSYYLHVHSLHCESIGVVQFFYPDFGIQEVQSLIVHMWLVGYPNPSKIKQNWGCTFSNLYTYMKTRWALKKNFHHWSSEVQASVHGQCGPSRLDWPCKLGGSSEDQWWIFSYAHFVFI